jgi:hypothetical protein
MIKIASIIILFTGEILGIFAEVQSARLYSITHQSFNEAFFKMLPVIIIAGFFLLTGYIMGLAAFKNIWVVSAISISSILIFEPALDYLITGQLPTRGALIGLIFGMLGIISALFL